MQKGGAKAPNKNYSGTGKAGSVDRAPYKGKTELNPSTPARKATNMTTAQAKAFDAKKKQQKENYDKTVIGDAKKSLGSISKSFNEGYRNFVEAGQKATFGKTLDSKKKGGSVKKKK